MLATMTRMTWVAIDRGDHGDEDDDAGDDDDGDNDHDGDDNDDDYTMLGRRLQEGPPMLLLKGSELLQGPVRTNDNFRLRATMARV